MKKNSYLCNVFSYDREKMRKHRTIPIFVPEMACPCRCVYCNQFVISGQQTLPTDEEIIDTIETHLSTMQGDIEIELGFFGGTFTGIAKGEQLRLMRLVQPYIERGRIVGMRCSTRPDRIESEWLEVLKSEGMKTIELGVQSMRDEVLMAAGRGYGAQTVIDAAKKIRDAGLNLGMQMMIGLPNDTKEGALETAQKIIECGANNTRIYPTLVLEDTVLAKRWRAGSYKALSIEEAVDWTAPVLELMETSGLEVLRVGLHPTEGFISGEDYLAGPFHVAFRLMVQTEIWRKRFEKLQGGKSVKIWVGKGMVNAAAGYGGKNKKQLLKRYERVNFREVDDLSGYEYGYEEQR